MQAGPYTWEDFVALDEDDQRELLDGYLVEVEVPDELHEYAVALLIGLLGAWVHGGHGGLVLASGYKIRIDPRRGWMPDVQFYQPHNLPRGQDDGLTTGHPDLVIEVISPGSEGTDRVIKMRDYAALGVPEYWIVDPRERMLHRLILREGSYVIADALVGDAVFRPASFEGLEIPLAELWETPDASGQAPP
jgi:Uma2 family endonuclease